jgi:hypothetical protein
MRIQPYTEDLVPAVKSFNERLRAGGQAYWSLPESHVTKLPRLPNRNPYEELFVVVDGTEIRGGYLLTHRRFALQGRTMSVACGPQISVSEGIVNRRYGMLGAVQARDAFERQPVMYALGIGGISEPLAMLLAAMRWTLFAVPFYFRVVSPSKLLANITYLRHSRSGGMTLELLRYSGLGSIGIRAAQLRLPRSVRVEAHVVAEFGAWADAIWEQCNCHYYFVAARDGGTLNLLYPPSDARFLRLRISRAGEDLGWVVMLDMQMSEHRYFGNMRVGVIVDCLAAPRNAYHLVTSATRLLESRGVDLIVTNQLNSAWCKAFFCAGFLKGPSNFILALSPMLADKFRPLKATKNSIHMTRGDGEDIAVWADNQAQQKTAILNPTIRDQRLFATPMNGG